MDPKSCFVREAVSSQIARFMGPTWGPPGSCRPQVGPMFTTWTLLSEFTLNETSNITKTLCHGNAFRIVALCEGNPPVIGGFPSKGPDLCIFDGICISCFDIIFVITLSPMSIKNLSFCLSIFFRINYSSRYIVVSIFRLNIRCSFAADGIFKCFCIRYNFTLLRLIYFLFIRFSNRHTVDGSKY